MAINLYSVISSAINTIVPLKDITIQAYSGYTNVRGVVTPSYTTIVTTASVQLEDKQKLMHINNINLSWIYKRFYVSNSALTGLNRGLNNGGDYIVMDNLNYKIIEVLENFETGWVAVIGCQSTE